MGSEIAFLRFADKSNAFVSISRLCASAAVACWVARPIDTRFSHCSVSSRIGPRSSPSARSSAVFLRTALRVYLDTWLAARKSGAAVPKLREGRRMRWLDTALAPVKKKLSKAEWRRLQAALALTLSIDALVVMKDVAHLDNEDALQTLRWAALAFVPVVSLLGTTAFISRDLAPVPLIWVAPLALYLTTFVLVFAPRPLLPEASRPRL